MYYKEIILDHYKNPRNRGRISTSTNSAVVYNPLCGDKITLDLVIKGGKVTQVKFVNEGCAISTAAASLLTEYIFNKELKDLIKLDRSFMIKLTGVEVGATRMKCLLLPLEALFKAVK